MLAETKDDATATAENRKKKSSLRENAGDLEGRKVLFLVHCINESWQGDGNEYKKRREYRHKLFNSTYLYNQPLAKIFQKALSYPYVYLTIALETFLKEGVF